MGLQSHTVTLPVGEQDGVITFPKAFTQIPSVLPTVQNLSGDDPILLIEPQVTAVTLSGFSYHLNDAPDTANYSLVYAASGVMPGDEIAKPAKVVRSQECGKSYITEEDIRRYVADHDTRSGMLDAVDYDFTPEDVMAAMESCAREYDGIPPYVAFAHPNRLPKVDNTFFDGTAYFLYSMALQQEQRHDTPYKAGSVEVDLAARRIGHYTKAMAFFYERFQTSAKTSKKLRNMSNAMGRVG